MKYTVTILGGGLAGCEAALWLADKGVQVKLYEQKPHSYSPAHTKEGLAELVCSNSFKSMRLDSAGGLLKAEMEKLGSAILPAAYSCQVAAGGALAVDRDRFSQKMTALIKGRPEITLVRQKAETLPLDEGVTIVATGPLTDGKLAQEIQNYTTSSQLSFYDAAAPIITADSIDYSKVFAASRYGRGEADYLNCPFNKENYEKFHHELITAQTAPLHDFDGPVTVYEGCMPVEVMAKRGVDTLRFGPLRPVGLTDPETGRRPYANVQLRQENQGASLYNLVGFQTNLKFGEQARVFRMIPGLEQAEFVRYGVMHRNTFLNSPEVLQQDLSLTHHPSLLFAGQITGFEGYMESAACGLLAARSALAKLQGRAYTMPPPTTMCGALMGYITTPNQDFQPMGANMGILPPLATNVRDKRERYMALAQRSLQDLENWQEL